MKFRSTVLSAVGALACVSAACAAHASTVLEYQGVGFITGTQTLSDSFAVEGPGTLTVNLANLNWPAPLASLNLVVTSPSGGSLGPEMNAGTATFNITSAGNVFAQWFGTAQGPLNAGVYGLEIQFQPIGATTVPLPTSIILLLSGIGLLRWQQKHLQERRGPVVHPS